jgi:hypothetical protein
VVLIALGLVSGVISVEGGAGTASSDECNKLVDGVDDEKARASLCNRYRSNGGGMCCYGKGQCVQDPPDGSSCTDSCPSGTLSPTGKEPCTNCPAGKHDHDSEPTTACRRCLPGFFSIERALKCHKCPPGQADSDSNPATACEACPPGTQSEQKNGSASIACGSCPPGRVDLDSNSATLCTNCRAGTYSTTATVEACYACGVGQYSGNGAAKCTPCTVRLPVMIAL